MKILVTGGAGFIGSHLVDALIKQGHAVRVLDNLEEQVHEGKKPSYLNSNAEYVWGDVRDVAMLRKILAGIEVVFHEAAAVGVGQSMYQIEKYVSANSLGTAVLLNTIVNDRIPIKKLIVASSMSIYGEGAYRCGGCGPVFPSLRPEDQLKKHEWEMTCPNCSKPVSAQPTSEEKPLIPTSVYAVVKRDQEELCLCVGRSYHIPTVALRYFNVYGPRQALSNPYTGVCAIFSSRIKNNHSPLVFEDGLQSRDFIHVSDIVKANLLVMQNPTADYGIFNVGGGRPVSVLEITQTLIDLYRMDVKPQLVQKYRAGDIRHCIADISKLQSLGFRPSVSLADGLKQLVEWGQGISAQDRVEAATKELISHGLTQG